MLVYFESGVISLEFLAVDTGSWISLSFTSRINNCPKSLNSPSLNSLAHAVSASDKILKGHHPFVNIALRY